MKGELEEWSAAVSCRLLKFARKRVASGISGRKANESSSIARMRGARLGNEATLMRSATHPAVTLRGDAEW